MMKSELLFLIRARTQIPSRRRQLDSPSVEPVTEPVKDGERVGPQKFGPAPASPLRRVLPRPQPVLLAGVFAFGGGGGAQALDPLLPPGENFSLVNWKLTLPDAGATEIFPAQLTNGYSHPTFFSTGADGAMVFWCPVTGGVTSGSSYPRAELRELLVESNDNVNWTTGGAHTLEAQCRVLQTPSSGKVVIGQIHAFGAAAQPLVKLQHDNGLVEALVKISPEAEADATYPFMTVALNTPISYRLHLTNGWLTITVNSSNQTVNIFQNHPAWAGQSFYFKAGSYCQDNVGPEPEGALVSFYQLNVTHTGDPHLAGAGLNSSRRFGFNLLAYTGQTYAIQQSPNGRDWTDVFTNPAPGSFNFLDPTPAAAACQFYRARQFP